MLCCVVLHCGVLRCIAFGLSFDLLRCVAFRCIVLCCVLLCCDAC